MAAFTIATMGLSFPACHIGLLAHLGQAALAEPGGAPCCLMPLQSPSSALKGQTACGGCTPSLSTPRAHSAMALYVAAQSLIDCSLGLLVVFIYDNNLLVLSPCPLLQT